MRRVLLLVLIALILIASACNLSDSIPDGQRLVIVSATYAASPVPSSTPIPTIDSGNTSTPEIFPTDIPTATSTFVPLASEAPIDSQAAAIVVTATPLSIRGSIASGTGGAYLRYYPGTAEEVSRIINEGAPLTIIGRTADGQWLRVVMDDGFVGWVLASSVTTEESTDILSIDATPNNGGSSAIPNTSGVEAVVQSGVEGLRLRATPGAGGTVVTILTELEPLTIIARTTDGRWLQVTTDDGDSGWVLAEYIDVYVDLEAKPVANVNLITSGFNGSVIEEGDGLRLRDRPSLLGNVLANLPGETPLIIIGRSNDNEWLEVRTEDGTVGWVARSYVSTTVVLDSLPVRGVTEEITPPPATDIISGVTSTSRNIYVRGQTLGNRPNVFSKVGDSITVAGFVLYPIGNGEYNLGEYSYLQPVVNYFSSVNAREGNSFNNNSLAADNGWTTRSVMDTSLANPAYCQQGEMPLECEYRVVRPSIALIMFGTNDVAVVPLDEYRRRMQEIVDISIDMGVIPVLSTVPNRLGFDVTPFNTAVRQIARANDIPLWDYHAALQNAPNTGLGEDGVHPSFASWHIPDSATFTPEFMEFGYNIRNLTALQVLDTVWRAVIY